MINVNKLESKLKENGKNITSLAGDLSIDKATLYRKLKNSEKLTVGEANIIVKVLHLTADEALEIFFTQFVA